MAALTLRQARSILGSYIEPSGDFTASLNQVLARIMSSGTYKDLTVQYSLAHDADGVITLPEDADSILHSLVDGYPTPVRSLWHDFKAIGMNSNIPFGFVDAGYWPTFYMPEEQIDTLCITPLQPIDTTPFSEANGERIRVVGLDAEGHQWVGTLADDGGPTVSFAAAISSIVSISFDGLLGRYALRVVRSDATTTVAYVGPDYGATRYRRFRLAPKPDTTRTVHVLCKRAFQPLVSDNDVLPVSNIAALKQGLLGRIAEDSADIERATYHWGQCVKAMEEEAASTMGAAIPRLNVDPYGTGELDRIPNLY